MVGERTAAVGAGDYAENSVLLKTPQVGSIKAKGVGLNSSNSTKKARSKACDECRKSKVGFASPSVSNMDRHILRANSVVAFMMKMAGLILSKLKSDLNQELPVQQRGRVPVRRTFHTSQASGKSKIQIENFFTLVYPRQMNLRVRCKI
jgi:hypothetical protein